MRRIFGKTLRARLNLIVLLTVMPAIGLAVYSASEQRSLERDRIYQSALMLTRAIAGEEDQMLHAARTTLLALSAAASRNGRLAEGCDGFDDIFQDPPTYLQLGVLSRDGRAACLAGVVGDGPKPAYTETAWFPEAVRSRRFVLGGEQVVTIDGRSAIYAAQPIIDGEGSVFGVAFAALSLDAIGLPLFQLLGGLPEGSTLVQIDPGSGQLVYDPGNRRWTNNEWLSASLVETVTRNGSGVLLGAGAAQEDRIFAYASLTSPLKGHPISVVLTMPKNRAFAASNRILVRNLVLLAVVAAFAVGFVWVATELFFLKPIGEMAAASQRLADGALDTRIGHISAADELRRLAGGFDHMAEALETRMAREREAKRELEFSHKQLRDLTGYLQDVREQERTRIARELHDDFGQSLTLLKLDLSWLKKRLSPDTPPVAAKLEAMGQVIDSALESMHVVTAALRPVILDDFGLAAAVEWQADDFKNRTGLDCRIEIDPKLPTVSMQLSTALFRIFQETLTNVMRHAEASRMEVRLRAESRQLVLSVEDDGRGITGAQIEDARSFGLIGIRERLRPFGGTVQFSGRPGRGTRVTVTIPIEEEAFQS